MEAKLFFTSLKYIPLVFYSLAVLFVIGFYVYSKIYKKQEAVNKKILNILIWKLIIFRLAYSVTLAVLQYVTWKKDTGLGQYFLPPHRPINYFALYSWTHFFAGAVISIGIAFVFYFILKAIKKHRAEIFEEGELELGLACTLIVGWPNAIFFIMLSFLMLLVVSAVRQMFFKEQFTTITIPLLVALLITFVFGNRIIDLLGISALRI